MRFEANPYYNPEKCGLTKVAELDFSSGAWEFDLSVVWTYGDEKAFYWADDAGCSCPSPFEGVSSFEQLTRGGFKEVRDHLNSRFDAQTWGTYVKINELHPALEKLHKIIEDWEVED